MKEYRVGNNGLHRQCKTCQYRNGHGACHGCDGVSNCLPMEGYRKDAHRPFTTVRKLILRLLFGSDVIIKLRDKIKELERISKYYEKLAVTYQLNYSTESGRRYEIERAYEAKLKTVEDANKALGDTIASLHKALQLTRKINNTESKEHKS